MHVHLHGVSPCLQQQCSLRRGRRNHLWKSPPFPLTCGCCPGPQGLFHQQGAGRSPAKKICPQVPSGYPSLVEDVVGASRDGDVALAVAALLHVGRHLRARGHHRHLLHCSRPPRLGDGSAVPDAFLDHTGVSGLHLSLARLWCHHRGCCHRRGSRAGQASEHPHRGVRTRLHRSRSRALEAASLVEMEGAQSWRLPEASPTACYQAGGVCCPRRLRFGSFARRPLRRARWCRSTRDAP